MSNKEGWTWLSNSNKWHYFRNNTSLCNRFMLLAVGDLEQGNDASPDNCMACRKKLEKERQLTPLAVDFAEGSAPANENGVKNLAAEFGARKSIGKATKA